MITVADLGEFGLIEHLARMVADARLHPPPLADFRLRLGIGDDAAVWETAQGLMVTTTDTMVEGVHFTSQTTPWPDVGWKVMAANLSDVAAMGALPLGAVVTLGLPGELALAEIEGLYQGMLEACRRYQLLLVGGDVVASPRSFVTVAINGVCSGEPLTRSAAHVGDAIAVTGPLGGSAGGLRLLQAAEPEDALTLAHRRPEPRMQEGQLLVKMGIRCAMDVSDGLVADLAKLCEASDVGARVMAAQVPIEPSLAERLPDDALQLALNGGEEYELLFAGPPTLVQRLVVELPGSAVIGEVTADPGSVTVLDSEGREMKLTTHGWDHLAP
jgi:thiamine-monophosphate kinase